jgi:chromosome segregation ATPase
MKRKMEAHESEISALKERTAVLSREKESIERTLDQIRTENVSLSHNRTDVELECSRIRKELDEKNGTIEFYAKETTAMRREIFDVESERIRLSQLLDVTQQQKAAMSLQFEDKKAVIVDLSEEISKLNGQLQSLQSEIVVSEEKRRILSSEMDDINGLITSALNVTSSQSVLRESAQHILHQLESFTFEKDTLEKKLSGMEQKHQLQKEELITSNNDLQKEIIALRNTFTSEMKNLEEKYQRDKKVLVEQFSQLNERNNQLLLDLNDLNMDYQRLKNESEQVSIALSQERDTAIISRNELQRECNQLRTDLVHLEKKKTSFLTEIQRITSPLISTSNPPRKYPSDKITVYRGSLNKTPHLSELRSSLQSTSSTTVDPEFIHADGTPQDSLSAIKNSLFSSNTDPVVEISVNSHENISSASDTTWKNDIETKLLALNSISQRANDAMKSLQLLTKIENKSLVETPCMSIDTSQTLHSTVAEYGLKETELFVQNLLFRN